MKAIFTQCSFVQVAALFLFILFFDSCKKQEDDLTKGFTTKIQQIVPTKIIDDLRTRGMTINEGQVPPTLQGAFLVSPFELVSPTGPEDSWQKGKIIDDYKYQFHDQTDAGDIKLDYTSSNDVGKGQGAFIAGNGNLFTIFAEVSSVTKNIPNKTLVVISGEITSTGIKNYQYALVMKEKTGDTSNSLLIAVDKGRVWKDGDGLSTTTSGFRLAAPTNVNSGNTLTASN